MSRVISSIHTYAAFAIATFLLIAPPLLSVSSDALATPTGGGVGQGESGGGREENRDDEEGADTSAQAPAANPQRQLTRRNRFIIVRTGQTENKQPVTVQIRAQQALDGLADDLEAQSREVDAAISTMEEFRQTQNEIRKELKFIDSLLNVGRDKSGNPGVRTRLLSLQKKQIELHENLNRQMDALSTSIENERNEFGQETVLLWMRDVAVAQSDVDTQMETQLAKVAGFLFGDTYTAREYAAQRPLGAGGNAETFVVTRENAAGEDVDFAMKFDPQIELAPDDIEAGFDPYNVRGAERSQASSNVARLLSMGHVLTHSDPVLINGKPAQEMELLVGHSPLFPEVSRASETRDRDGLPIEKYFKTTQQEMLASYRNREIAIRNLESREKLSDLELSDLATARTNHARFELKGNPVVILEREAIDPDPRLDGAQSRYGFDDPVLQERLNQMQFTDLLNGQIDRNLSNILIKYEAAKDENGQDIQNDANEPVSRVTAVTGIDNNMSMGTRRASEDQKPARLTTKSKEGEEELVQPIGTLPPLPKKVDLSVAAAWLGKTEAQFLLDIGLVINTEESTEKDGLTLSAEQKIALFQRFQVTRNHIIELVKNGDLVTSPTEANRDAKLQTIANALGVNPAEIGAQDVWGNKPGWQNYFREQDEAGAVSQDYEAELRYHDGSYLARIVKRHDRLKVDAAKLETAIARRAPANPPVEQ